ncbi:hypothetical protein [Hydrogenophaga sp.]|uniref:hypothetical protein n=1 Tax=Hydrogenophaga sp. TaxID=1904254 RepID=UPI0025C47F10|nr:hypothetical protein [Hydrogenophaga sp.]
MSPALQTIARPWREHGPALVAGVDNPHDEVMALVWGPRFDREHAMWLWSRLSRREPQQAAPVLPALLGMAEDYDALETSEQRRVRRLIMRHRSLTGAGAA